MKEREPLDEVERQVLDFVGAFIHKMKRGPSLEEVSKGLDWTSTGAAVYRLQALERKGYLLRPKDPRGWQCVQIVMDTPPALPKATPVAPVTDPILIPYRGKVSCGQGIENDEEFENEPLDVGIPFRRSDLVAYTARGDSMIDAHIAPGDTLLVEPDPDPPIGSIVVAMLGRDMVCKKLTTRTAVRVVLKPCNGEAEGFDFCPFARYFLILGVLKHILRDY